MPTLNSRISALATAVGSAIGSSNLTLSGAIVTISGSGSGLVYTTVGGSSGTVPLNSAVVSSATSAGYASAAGVADSAPGYLPLSGGNLSGDLIVSSNAVSAVNLDATDTVTASKVHVADEIKVDGKHVVVYSTDKDAVIGGSAVPVYVSSGTVVSCNMASIADFGTWTES